MELQTEHQEPSSEEKLLQWLDHWFGHWDTPMAQDCGRAAKLIRKLMQEKKDGG